MDGATVPELASKWRVSKSAVRAQITRKKMTKRDHGDRVVRAQASARAAEIEAARAETPEARAARLFDAVEGEDAEAAGDPGALGRLATLASGRAMKGRLWAEARALAGLAESNARLEEKQAAAARGGGGSIETMELERLLDIVLDRDERVSRRFYRTPGDAHDPDEAVKAAYWSWQSTGQERASRGLWALLIRAEQAETRLRDLGEAWEVNLTDEEIEAWVRAYLRGPRPGFREGLREGTWGRDPGGD